MVSNLIYFAFIPIGVWILLFLIVEIKEQVFHHYSLNKTKIYLWAAIICTILAVLIVLLSLVIKV